jgi:hypothetical protein
MMRSSAVHFYSSERLSSNLHVSNPMGSETFGLCDRWLFPTFQVPSEVWRFNFVLMAEVGADDAVSMGGRGSPCRVHPALRRVGNLRKFASAAPGPRAPPRTSQCIVQDPRSHRPHRGSSPRRGPRVVAVLVRAVCGERRPFHLLWRNRLVAVST